MANDVYTKISYKYLTLSSNNKLFKEDQVTFEWNLFIDEIMEVEYEHTENNLDGMSMVLITLFPEHHGDWDYEKNSNVLGTKWCNLHQVDGGYIEFHSAWNAPTGILERIQKVFGKDRFTVRVEDNDWGLISDVEYKDNTYHTKCLTASYYQKFVSALKGRNEKVKELLKETTFYNDDYLDRYEAVDFINPVLFDSIDEVVYELSCSSNQDRHLWKFNRTLLLNGLSDTTLNEVFIQ